MLKTLRVKTKKIMWATLITVIPSFIFFYGFGSMDRRRQRDDAQPFGTFQPKGQEEIALNKEHLFFARWEKQSELTRLYGMAEGGLVAHLTVQDQLEKSGISLQDLFPNEDLVTECMNEWILNQAADEHNIEISHDELLKILGEKLQGYSKEMRRIILQRLNMNPERLANYVTKSEKLQRARLPILNQAKASLFELWEIHRLENEEIALQYEEFKVADYEKKVEVPEDKLALYYSENKEDFRVGDQRLYSYAYLAKESLRSKVALTDSELEKHFNANLEAYKRPLRTKIRHILISTKPPQGPFDPASADAFTSQALRRAYDIKAQLDAGADFRELANLYSEDPQNTTADGTKLGGSLEGWISASESQQYDPQFVTAASQLKEGQISEPISVANALFEGFSIMKCDGVQEATIPEFAKLNLMEKNKLRADLIDIKVDALFNEKKALIDNEASAHTTIDGLALAMGMETGKTSYMLTTERVIDQFTVGTIDESDMDYLNKQISVGKHSDLLETQNFMRQDRALVLQLDDEKPEHIPPFEEIKGQVEEAYRLVEGRKLMKKAAEDFLKTARAVVDPVTTGTLVSLAAASELTTPTTTVLFSRTTPPGETTIRQWLDFDIDSLVAKPNEFHLSQNGPSEEEAQAYAVWRISNTLEPAPETFKEKRIQNAARLVNAKQSSLLAEWLQDRRKNIEKKVKKD